MDSHEGDDNPQPDGLQVDNETDPTNIDPNSTPRFSWRCETTLRNAGQAAYRVVVGRDIDRVAEGVGDVWDSDWVESDSATDISYDGPPLSSNETYVWSVRTRSWRGNESEWAAPAEFSTALREQDWKGDWIAHQPGVGDTDGWRGKWRSEDWSDEEWVQIDLGEEREISTVTLFPASPVTTIRTPDGRVITEDWSESPIRGFGFPDHYRVEVSNDPLFADSTVVADGAGPDGEEANGRQTARKIEPARHEHVDGSGRYLRITATDLHTLAPEEHSFVGGERKSEQVRPWQCFALASVSVEDPAGAELATDRPTDASSSVESETWGLNHLVNGIHESRRASSSPHLRTDVTVDKPVSAARLHVATVGYGETYVNGDCVSPGSLNPAWTDYKKRVLYDTYDVADELQDGENTVGLWLGRGWFSKSSAHWTSDGSPRARATLTIEFEDGTIKTIATDENWDATESPIVANDIYDGERYDARREHDEWAQPTADTSDWTTAEPVAAPGGVLKPQRIQPMDVVEEFSVEEVHEHPDGPILDFGQNLTGWLEIEVTGASAGDEITLSHAEALTEDGDLSTTDLRTADATDTYVSKGEDAETYAPRFTYHGFRYAQISGYPGEFNPEDVTAKVVHTAMDRRGEFACSNDDLNQVQHNAVWGLRGNTHSVPEDCPQRDERFGWTGDAQISTRSLLFNYDGVRFDEKWMRDHDDAASEMGYVTDVIPDRASGPADPTWSVTRVMIPWYLYRHDGDEQLLREQYESMRNYLEYWYSVTEDGILPETYGKYGDWLAFENNDEEIDDRRGLPIELFTTAYHYQVTDTFAKIASVVGNESDAREFRERAAEIKSAFNDRFLDAENATYGPGTQSSYAVPLYMGLVPEEHVDSVVANLVEKVEADGGKLRTGFLGTRPLIHTLADHGHADLAYHVVSQPEQPGWVYMAQHGATTMWERWDSDESVGSGMNSLNHSPFTHVSEFFYEDLAGIRIGDQPITDHVTIAPALVEDLDWVEASVESPNGTVASSWARTDDGYEVSVTIPWNTVGTIRLPDAASRSVTESGIDLNDAPKESIVGIRRQVQEGSDVVFEVGSGTYDFTVS